MSQRNYICMLLDTKSPSYLFNLQRIYSLSGNTDYFRKTVILKNVYDFITYYLRILLPVWLWVFAKIKSEKHFRGPTLPQRRVPDGFSNAKHACRTLTDLTNLMEYICKILSENVFLLSQIILDVAILICLFGIENIIIHFTLNILVSLDTRNVDNGPFPNKSTVHIKYDISSNSIIILKASDSSK